MKGDEASAWAVLAALRFFLALVVVVGHCSFFVGGRHDWSDIGLWLNQGSAVFGFFILSGYSIAASLEREETGFYRRRFVRIWPTYLACLSVGLLVAMVLPQGLSWPTGRHMPPATVPEIVASFLMLQTVIGYAIPAVGQIWSLSPEWWHYMIAPGLVRLSSITLICWLGMSFCAFMLIPPPPGGGPEGFTHGLGFLTLSWLWITGFLYRRLALRPVGAVILAAPSTCALFFGHFTGLPLFISIFMLLLSHEMEISVGWQKVLNWAGDVSYPLYLFHMPVLAILVSRGYRNTLLMTVTSLLLSVLALQCIDYPCRAQLRRRIPKNVIAG